MSTELSKTYDPAAVEAETFSTWMAEKAFHPDPAGPGDGYSIVIPPPNVTGALHLGHAINNTLQDILTRKARMEGRNALWVPGIDHAGIATQAVVEKQLKEKENKTRHDVGREGLVERIWQWKEQYGNRIIDQLKRMGCSCDWDRTRFTLDDMLARAVRETFFKLFKDGLIYRGKRLVNWDTHLQTSISDDELYTETVKTNLWHIRYPIEGMQSSTGFQPVPGHGQDAHATYMTIATTRPETMLADTAVAVHPGDPRWNWAIGKQVRLPLTDRLIPIIADPILVDMTFGSGAVKVTPAHDANDYAVWQRQKGSIEILNLMTPDGKVSDDPRWAAYAGLTLPKARKQVVEDLLKQGFMTEADIKPHEANVNFSDRSKTAIEPYLSDQWFVKMAPLAEPALEVVRNGRVKFFPERHSQQYLAWLGEKRDWPISRQLWWGHRIPVWTKTTAVESGKPPVSLDNIHVHEVKGARVAIRTVIQDELCHNFVCIPPGHADVEKEFEAQGYVQDPDVLDTWFSSALWPHSTLGWPDRTPELAKWYPTSVLVTGRDIITLWVARMVMTGLYNMGDVPFAHVVINPTILDGHGRRMSKTAGNGVDPVDIIENQGADAMRFTLTTMATETQEARLPVKKDAQGRNTSEKFDIGRNFCTKIWNAARFVLSTIGPIAPEPVDEQRWSMADRWIVSRFNRTVEECNGALAVYRFDAYAKACYDFFWRDFCDWYVESTKPALRDPARAGQTANVLAAVLDGALRLMHPAIPFITEKIWWNLCEVRPKRELPGRIAGTDAKRLVKAPWPAVGDVSQAAEHIFPRVQEIVGAIRNVRNDYKADPKKTVPVSISAGPEAARSIENNREAIELLATCTLGTVRPDLAAPANAARASAANCEIYVEGLIDPEAEQQRLAKRKEELLKQRGALQGRLSNEAYIAKAPPKLVNETKQQLADVEAELSRLG